MIANTASEELVNLVEKTGVYHIARHASVDTLMHAVVLRWVKRRREEVERSDLCRSLIEKVLRKQTEVGGK